MFGWGILIYVSIHSAYLIEMFPYFSDTPCIRIFGGEKEQKLCANPSLTGWCWCEHCGSWPMTTSALVLIKVWRWFIQSNLHKYLHLLCDHRLLVLWFRVKLWRWRRFGFVRNKPTWGSHTFGSGYPHWHYCV